MATLYVSSVDGDNSSPPSVSWWNGNQTTYASVAGALAQCADSENIIYVDSAHDFVSASETGIQWSLPENSRAVAILGTNRSTGARATGAKETANGTTVGLGISSSTVDGKIYVYGMECVTGTTSGTIVIGNALSTTTELESCILNLRGTTSYIAVGNSAGSSHGNFSRWRNVHVVMPNGTVSGVIRVITHLIGGLHVSGLTLSYTGANKPTVLFAQIASARGTDVIVADSDLTGFDSGTYFGGATNRTVVRNCKLHATPTRFTNFAAGGSGTLINCDSGNTKIAYQYATYTGSIEYSTAVYADNGFRHSGTNLSWKIVTTASCREFEPFVTPWLIRPCETTSEITAGMRLVHDSATDLHNRNCWADFEYVSDASFPLGTLLSTRNTQPFDGTAVDWTNDNEAWTGISGFTNPNSQSVNATFTPAQTGILRSRLYLAVADKTVYLDPLLRVSSDATRDDGYWSEPGSFADYAASGGSGPRFGDWTGGLR